ncbi:single-stranded DNA-binding protein [Halocynthiibacter sp. C4]|uniref:single-stranded DNA-binding protein n=1 Tax=Halocynthiibacter sp. C4 TaxID=2992758 RepID=UPI00237C2F6F|nr:single-stranded DNA-binding protein [Halocynthiibacter sp. C4]MDE0590434.1 single-stranded DNA-binding protein [Halocynthiibacter sp. C4]
MQKLIIAGNVGKDAELRRTQNGDAVLGFSVAVDNGKDKNGNKRETTWIDCSVWGKRAESLENHIKKGIKLTLEGRPTVREHNGKAYLGMSVNELTFQGGGSQGSNQGQQQGSAPAGGYSGIEDAIPF